MSVTTLPLGLLVQRCTEEDDKFSRRQPSDDTYSFELLRRALQEQQPEALQHVQQLYERRLTSWVYHHGLFAQTGESADYFVQAAFSAFYLAVSGEKFTRFSALPRLMQYLKVCVGSAIMQYMRDQHNGATQALDSVAEQSHTPDLGARIHNREVLEYIFSLLPNPRDRSLVVYAFVQGLRPREIVALPGAPWSSEREVTLDLHRIRKLLRSDSGLRGLINL